MTPPSTIVPDHITTNVPDNLFGRLYPVNQENFVESISSSTKNTYKFAIPYLSLFIEEIPRLLGDYQLITQIREISSLLYREILDKLSVIYFQDIIEPEFIKKFLIKKSADILGHYTLRRVLFSIASDRTSYGEMVNINTSRINRLEQIFSPNFFLKELPLGLKNILFLKNGTRIIQYPTYPTLSNLNSNGNYIDEVFKLYIYLRFCQEEYFYRFKKHYIHRVYDVDWLMEKFCKSIVEYSYKPKGFPSYLSLEISQSLKNSLIFGHIFPHIENEEVILPLFLEEVEKRLHLVLETFKNLVRQSPPYLYYNYNAITNIGNIGESPTQPGARFFDVPRYLINNLMIALSELKKLDSTLKIMEPVNHSIYQSEMYIFGILQYWYYYASKWKKLKWTNREPPIYLEKILEREKIEPVKLTLKDGNFITLLTDDLNNLFITR